MALEKHGIDYTEELLVDLSEAVIVAFGETFELYDRIEATIE